MFNLVGLRRDITCTVFVLEVNVWGSEFNISGPHGLTHLTHQPGLHSFPLSPACASVLQNSELGVDTTPISLIVLQFMCTNVRVYPVIFPWLHPPASHHCLSSYPLLHQFIRLPFPYSQKSRIKRSLSSTHKIINIAFFVSSHFPIPVTVLVVAKSDKNIGCCSLVCEHLCTVNFHEGR